MSDNTAVIQGLRILLANTFTLYLKTQKYHWNVVGPHFYALHLFFESQYQELYEAVDAIAEHIRTLNVFAPGSYSEFSELTTIQDAGTELSSDNMIADLLTDHEKLLNAAGMLLKDAEAIHDAATADFVTARCQAHQKHTWMLRSFLKQ